MMSIKTTIYNLLCAIHTFYGTTLARLELHRIKAQIGMYSVANANVQIKAAGQLLGDVVNLN